MELIKRNEPYEEIRSILERPDTNYYFGIYNVLFGQRIRAGRYGECYVDLDWCCGNQLHLVAITYIVLQRHLESWDGVGNPFSGLPTCSRIKPFNKDKEFLDKVSLILPEFKSIEYVER